MTTESTHDFVALAAQPNNEQRMTASLESIDATMQRIETRLFAFINALPKPIPVTPVVNKMTSKK